MARDVAQAHGGSIRLLEPGETANPYGRPKKLVSTLISDLKEAGFERVGAADISATIEGMIGLPIGTVRKLSKDNDQPLAVKLIAKAMLSAKGFDALQSLLDRAHGKAKQQVDLSGAGAIPVPAVTVVVQAVTPNGG
jgi:hypothetical protein